MKKINVWIVVLSILAWSTGTALAETYIEGYIGNSFSVTSPNPIEFSVNPAFRGPTRAIPEYPRTLSSAMIGGFKLGTWFSKEGFPQIDYPDWMKYFGVYFDFSYHWLDYKPGVGSRRMYFLPNVYPFFQFYKFLGNGSITTLAFMFAFRYGFLPTEKVPFGRLQPYVAVGPAILITGLKPGLMFQPAKPPDAEVIPLGPQQIPYKSSGSFSSTVCPALEAELGLRWLFTREDGPPGRAISLETSVKYRYARPTADYNISFYGVTHQLRYAPQLNLFSIQAGLAYHF